MGLVIMIKYLKYYEVKGNLKISTMVIILL